MKLRDFSLCLVLVLITGIIQAQYSIKGKITSNENKPIPNAEVYNKNTGEIKITDQDGAFIFEDVEVGNYTLAVFTFEYNVKEKQVAVSGDTQITIALEPLGEELSEVVLIQRREKLFGLQRLKPVEGTAIYAGKKTEVVLVDQITGNLAANSPRQIYSQVVGLNIYENGDAGLQLNIGGRGLDPNRTANFNTRQNGYDISADALGYPENYYTPPAEALSEIQVIRGAASLQYGPQFGGLINFKFKKPNPNKNIELITRQTLGSYGLFTSFNSLSGTVGKFSYYTYFNYKSGDGFRPNSEFDSKNYFGHIGYQFTDKTKLSFEFTYLDYLAQQAGGLTDSQFEEDPTFSNRSRNWFEVDWKLYALKLEHKFSEKTDFSLNLFGLDASRKALGYRENRVSQEDPFLLEPTVRELLIDNFTNWGAEARLLSKYKIGSKDAVFLIGSKYYQTKNDSKQGPGTAGTDADFSFAEEQFPAFNRQSEFEFPNTNVAVFGENIFNLSDAFSVTPGVRFEYIKTESEGDYRRILTGLSPDDVILDESLSDNRTFERSFVLLGLGASYKKDNGLEFYGNISQNYRSITFSDIRVTNPSLQIDPDITDEEGFTADLGVRGKLNNILSFDADVFALAYNDRIGTILQPERGFNSQGEEIETANLVQFRTNTGDAIIYGFEGFVDWNIKNTFFYENDGLKLNYYLNTAITDSEYTNSKNESNNIDGNKVEFIPNVNIKTGIKFGYKNFLGSIQYTYLSEQFTDASNADAEPRSQSGIEGEIPAYDIMDVSLSYTYKKWKLETGVNNVLDNTYFTRRATGYPGPGIIPAEPLTWYTTLQFKF
ncbi:TonB-dependent receptor domain-containing protein [Aquimarina rhabdastrellae]